MPEQPGANPIGLSGDRDAIGSALARIPSGCSILTATHDGRSTGVLVSWVQQAAFSPPAITVCLNRERAATPLVESAGRFVLNVIGSDPTTMFKHFGRGFRLDEDAFAGLSVEPSSHGPVLRSCIAGLACAVRAAVPCGDHVVYVAEVVAAHAEADSRPYVHLRKSGLSY